MGFFDFLFQSKKKKTANNVVVRNVQPSGAIPVSKIPKVDVCTLGYYQQHNQGRGHFFGGEYDLSEIGKICDTESYVRQAFKKKQSLMFKEGYGFKGSNKQRVQYVKTRLAQIARASGIPTSELVRRVGQSLIRTSNAFLIKVRSQRASGGQKRKEINGKTLAPVAAYFPAAPEMMRVDIDRQTGKIRLWRQLLPNGRFYNFLPEDVIHFTLDRREGFLFGVPEIIPVADDIRALRQIEENIELLLYQHLFPLFHYKVGTETAPAGMTETGEREIELVEQQVRMMPNEGAIVTPERHEIKAIGAEGRALRAESYLGHFQQRVFSGLGVSSVDMGIGDTANRATANTLSRQLVDSVKNIQDTLEIQFDHFVIKELLLESTFGDDVLEEQNLVHLSFHEIDLQNKIEQEKHRLEMFAGNAITWDELRKELNHEPIPVPEHGDDQDPSKYPEWFNTNWKLFKEPENLIRAVDEPYSASAIAAAESRSAGTTSQGIAKAAKEGAKREQIKTQEERKTKIAIAKMKPTPRASRDNFIHQSYTDLEHDFSLKLNQSIESKNTVNQDDFLPLGKAWVSQNTGKFVTLAVREMIDGFNRQTGMKANQAETLIGLGRNEIQERVNHYLTRLVDTAIRIIQKRFDNMPDNAMITKKDLEQQIHLTFDALRYRTISIWDTELKKAHNYGRVLGMRFMGKDSFEYEMADENSCEKCKAMNGQKGNTRAVVLDDMPPLHPHSRMKIKDGE